MSEKNSLFRPVAVRYQVKNVDRSIEFIPSISASSWIGKRARLD